MFSVRSPISTAFQALLRRSRPQPALRGLAVVKSALDENNLCLAQIAAVQLRIPDLPVSCRRRPRNRGPADQNRARRRCSGARRLGPGQAPARRHTAQSGLVRPDRGLERNELGAGARGGRAHADGNASIRPNQLSITQAEARHRYCRSPSAAPATQTTPPARCGWTGTFSARDFTKLKTGKVLAGMTM